MLQQVLAGRIERLRAAVRASGLDAYIVSTEENIWYLTNLVYKPEERPFFIVVLAEGKPTLVVPLLEARHLGAPLIDCRVVFYPEFPAPAGRGWSATLGGVLGGKKSVGIEGKLKEAVAAELADFSLVRRDLVEELRLVKSPYEIERIKRTAETASAAMGRLLRGLYSGASVIEAFSFARQVQASLLKSGEYNPLSTYLLTAAWPAPESAMPHSVPDLGLRFGAGPCVAMCYFRINGYAAECERTFFVEKPGAEDRERFAAMMEAREKALAVLRPGVPCSEIDAAGNGWLRTRGYGGNILHRTGHGIGLGNHEEPWLAEGDDRRLEENMVVSIEPGIYLDDVGGFRHSDTVLVTGNGYEILAPFPISIDELTQKGWRFAARTKGALMRAVLGVD